MNLSIQRLTTIADCDMLLSRVTKEKEELKARALAGELFAEKFIEGVRETDAALQSVAAEIASVDTIIPLLPDGNVKEAMVLKRTQLEYKKFTLENRKKRCDAVPLLKKQLELARLLSSIEQIDGAIAAVETRKKELMA